MPERFRRKPFFLFSVSLACLFTAFFLTSGAPVFAGGKAAHPVIPGFERFFADAGAEADKIQGGRLLLAELNCTSCHQASSAQQAYLLPKQAPILTSAGNRIKPSYVRKFLNNPHAVKPGTAMPDVLSGLAEKEKQEAVESLVHLLASTGTLQHEALRPNLIGKGKTLFHEAGCVACHGTRTSKGLPDKVLATSVPLPDLKEKYTLPSLTAFLQSPHDSRPSGRMPGLVLTPAEAREIAAFLLQGLPGPPANLTFAYYEGNWDNMPDFRKLKPKFEGQTHSIDLGLAARKNNYALVFSGYLKIDNPGQYKFWLSSDDGSQIRINDNLVVNNDGIHPTKTVTNSTQLTKGMHKIEVSFFQGGGETSLQLEMQGPKVKKQPVSPFIFLTPQGNPATVKSGQEEDANFTPKAELVAKGKVFFAELGCASCHDLKLNGQKLEAKQTAPALAKLKTSGGCLDHGAGKGIPQFALSKAQQNSLAAAIKALASPPVPLTTQATIKHTMTTFNCYTCHERDKIGGPEQAINAYFVTTQPEMGEEGRLPPPLDGVGAKLKKTWMQHLFANGNHDRPYMHTRMPKFGLENTGHLVEAFAQSDTIKAVKVAPFKETISKVKSAGRHMVGAKAFGCIKCHTFAGKKAEGVQGIDMTVMAERLNQDWFHHYLLDPQKIRMGTRMPASWPKGQTQLPNLLDGDSHKQIEAIWLYLLDGKKASTPIGVGSQFIELIPEKEAIIYRNFIAGGGTRAIGVGYPEHANLAFDANNMSLAMIWQGAFIDASKHWTDRGAGYQPPLGENVLNLPTGATFAFLSKDNDPWPGDPAKKLGYKFKGYRLTPDERPTFLYTFRDIDIEDFPNAIESKQNPTIKRTFTLKAAQPVMNLWFRAAVASKIDKIGNGLYSIEGKWQMQIESTSEPVIRQAGGNQELLVPVAFKNNQATITQQYIW